jgi:hypothetical protein
MQKMWLEKTLRKLNTALVWFQFLLAKYNKSKAVELAMPTLFLSFKFNVEWKK